jgi:hypothetical protein
MRRRQAKPFKRIEKDFPPTGGGGAGILNPKTEGGATEDNHRIGDEVTSF